MVYTEFDRKVEASTGFSCSDTTFPKKKTASAKKKERCIMKDKKAYAGIIVTGAVIGLIAVALVFLGNPKNMGL